MNDGDKDRDLISEGIRWANRATSSLKETFSDRRVLWGLLLGQFLSLLITATGVTSQLLATEYDVNIPTTQSSINYLLLFFVYMPTLFYQRRSRHRGSSPSADTPSPTQRMLEHEATPLPRCAPPVFIK
jgi:hypothetical protein